MSDVDDPGPNRNCTTGCNHQLFSGVGETVDQKEDRTMGLFDNVRESSGVCSIGSVLSGMVVFCFEPHLRLFVLARLARSLEGN